MKVTSASLETNNCTIALPHLLPVPSMEINEHIVAAYMKVAEILYL